MTQIDEEEQCIALTNKGERCSHIAKDGRFCFQHDQDSPTIDGADSNTEHFLNIVSDKVDFHAEQLSGVQRDVAQNLKDVINQAGSISDALISLNLHEAADEFKSTVSETAPTPAKYGMVGGVLGSPGGPIGTATGTTGGVWYGVYKVMDDDRAVRASIVKEVPEDAEMVPSDHRAIEDVQPIQMAIRSAIEKGEQETEWLRTTLIRERNMDRVEEALQEIPEYRSESGSTEYYIRDADTEEDLVLIFGVPANQ